MLLILLRSGGIFIGVIANSLIKVKTATMTDTTSAIIERDDGFTLGNKFHGNFMSAIWIPCVNIAIILIIYAYRKYWVWLHMAFFVFALVITLVSSFGIYARTGMIPANSTEDYGEYSGNRLRGHYILGFVAIALIIAVSILGTLTKLLNIFNARSSTIILVRKIHTWSGYLAVLACKANIYILKEFGWLAVDVICLLIYVLWGKIFFPKLEGKQISPKYKQ